MRALGFSGDDEIVDIFGDSELVMTGWFTGFLQEYVGYRLFFLLVAMLGVISFIVTYFLPVTEEIGKRKRMV